ncbi:MAG: histidine--tRNA ligase [Patescibacteria group bacterium]
MQQRFINPSGFTENLPAVQLVENELKSIFGTVAEQYGYVPLETAAVEYLETLASKGDIDKEIYTIGRALAEGSTEEAERGLHFDLTVPFARYVAQHQGELSFPFRRYQIQKVWRGERPQQGRFREFYQADVDVVAPDTLPITFDAEVITVMARILSAYELGPCTMHINHRQLLTGLLEYVGITPSLGVMQALDKLDKRGVAAVQETLQAEHGARAEAVTQLFAWIGQPIPLAEAATWLDTLPIEEGSEALVQGQAELRAVCEQLTRIGAIERISFELAPAIARGLDYYTGTVVETTLDGYEQYGSICSGGRYADLASRFTKQRLPGVGLSIGLTRLLSIIRTEGLRELTRHSASDVLVGVLDATGMSAATELAEKLRAQGLRVEQVHKTKQALSKQLDLAATRGIPLAVLAEQDGTYTCYPVTPTGSKVRCETLVQLLEQISSQLKQKR